MKKGILFGFGLLLAGSALAATLTVNTVSIDSKNPGDFVSNEEFNLITSGINAITTMFHGASDNGTSITVPKTITATSLSAPEVCINGDCQIEWPTGGAGITDQACGAGQVVQGITGGTFDCVLDANDGGASSPIGTLQAGKWCWSPDGTTLDCDRQAPSSSTGCVDYQYSKCVGDKIYWFDSCDNITLDPPKEDCTSLGGCTANEIGGTCLNSASGGGITITPQTCPAGQHLYKANSNGTFVCSDDSAGGGTSPWVVSTNPAQITYAGGNVGIKSSYPAAELEVGGKIIATELCIDTPSVADVCTSKSCAADIKTGASGSTCFTQATLTALESVLADGSGSSTPSYWDATSGYTTTAGSAYFNQTGNVGIGTTSPSAKLHVYGGNIKISGSGGTGGDLVAEGSIQVGGHYCPAPGVACAKAGEIASCGAGGQILACAGTSSQWMPITSHNGTVVGSTSDACSSANAGTMRFLNGMAQSLQICMKLSGSATYSWRTIMSGGGNAS